MQHDCQYTEEFKDISKDLTDIRTALGIKDITNGQIKQKMKEIGERAEEEDKELKSWLLSVDKRLRKVEGLITYMKALVILNGLLIAILLAYIRFG